MPSDARRLLPINLQTVNCPQCGQPMPPIRVPANVQELMWGGWTCPACGCRMDKWGNALPPRS